MVFGIIMVRSATINTPGLEDLVERQVLVAVLGFGLLFVMAAIEYRFFGTAARVLYLVTLGVLALVSAIGFTQGGAQRWLETRSWPRSWWSSPWRVSWPTAKPA